MQTACRLLKYRKQSQCCKSWTSKFSSLCIHRLHQVPATNRTQSYFYFWEGQLSRKVCRDDSKFAMVRNQDRATIQAVCFWSSNHCCCCVSYYILCFHGVRTTFRYVCALPVKIICNITKSHPCFSVGGKSISLYSLQVFENRRPRNVKKKCPKMTALASSWTNCADTSDYDSTLSCEVVVVFTIIIFLVRTFG